MESYGSFHVRIPDNAGGGAADYAFGLLTTTLVRGGTCSVLLYDREDSFPGEATTDTEENCREDGILPGGGLTLPIGHAVRLLRSSEGWIVLPGNYTFLDGTLTAPVLPGGTGEVTLADDLGTIGAVYRWTFTVIRQGAAGAEMPCRVRWVELLDGEGEWRLEYGECNHT